MSPKEDLEEPERQAPLRKWVPYLWIPPLLLVLLLALLAYLGVSL
jgi:hypothetical protein